MGTLFGFAEKRVGPPPRLGSCFLQGPSQKKVGYHTWHECVDPNPEICHRIDSAIKAYLRKGGKGAATKSICRHQDDFRDAFEHNHEKCKELIRKADHEGLHLPGSMEDLKHMCR